MTQRLVRHLETLSIEALRNIYGAARLEAKQPEETSAEFDAYALDQAKIDNCLQLAKPKINQTAIELTYIALTTLRARPECQQGYSPDHGINAWLDMVARHLNTTRKRARLIVYNELFCDPL